MDPEVWVDGRPLTSIAWWGDLEVTHHWPLGSWEAKWSMPLDPWARPPQLRVGALVEVRVGPHVIWAGDLAEPSWADGSFAAVGACRQGENAIALDNATGQTTSIANKAVDDAISRGALNWTRPATISPTPLADTDQTDSLNYVAAVLDAFAQSVSKQWYVNPRREVRLAPDPTLPAALLMPDNGVLGTAVGSQVGTVIGRYTDSTSHALSTAYYGSGLPERGFDWTDRGEMTAAAATALCQGVWTPGQAQVGWTNGLTIRPGELLTPGGVELPLWAFTAGPSGMLRLLGVRDLRGLSSNTDIIAAETIWSAGADEALRVNPVGKVARDIRAIAEAAGGTEMPTFSG